MLTLQGCLARRKRLWESLPQDVEWLIVADSRHVHYLCNFWLQPLCPSGGERAWLCLERSGPNTLLCDNFVRASAVAEPYVDREIIEPWYDHRHSVINRDHALLAALARLQPELAGRRGMVEAEALPIAAGELLQLPAASRNAREEFVGGPVCHDLGTALRAVRRRKEPDEIALLHQCMRAAEAGMARAREVIRPGVSEMAVYRAVADACHASAGCPGLVYGDFRATNAEKPGVGGLPTDYTLQASDLFILDFSFVLDGYRGDFTNTFALGPVSPALRDMHALCVAAMRAGEASLMAGARASTVYSAVLRPFRDAGRPELFTHHAGHGLGLAHPEPPILVPESIDILQAGDVITLEPGAYARGLGGMRIERNYLITATGYEQMSRHLIALD